MKLKSLTALLSLLTALAMLMASPARAGFDPVHQDIDIFMTNPAMQSERPNVLIILDTSANWQSYFANEKSALISVVNGLNEQYNVGIAMNTGANIQGSYIRYAIRPMTATNRAALSSLINLFDNSPATTFNGDKTNNPAPGQSMVEVYRYFKGLSSFSATTSNAGHDPRTDYNGNTLNTWITSLPGNAFTTTPAVTTNYESPVKDVCQKNFVIYISNGKGSNQIGETKDAKDQLTAAQGSTATAITPLSPSGNETDSWFDEWAKFLAGTGFSMTVNGNTRDVKVQTYVIEVNPGTQSQDLQFTATMRSGATNGKGKYFAATGADPGASLVAALNAIFNEIQAVNSVFASTTLPVSVNVRGTNLNQVYIGMFRPDANKAPRWFGNLKLYKLALAADDITLQLVDAANTAAESTTTGFINSTARSYWTFNSDFWQFRTIDENGVGGQSDSPDGDLVEKGAAAQQLRTTYASSQAGRRLYTCTTGGFADCTPCTIGGSGTAKTCSSGAALSTTPFSTANTDIGTVDLGLGTKDVSPLTAKVIKSVTGLADRRPVTINNASAGSVSATITAISNGAVSRTLTSLSAFDSTKTQAIGTLTALGSPSATMAIGDKANTGSSVTLEVSVAGNPCSGRDTVVVAGNDASVDGTWNITSSAAISATPARSSVTFTVSSSSPTPKKNAGTVTCYAKTTTATATMATWPAGLAVGSRINVSNATPAAFSGDFVVTAVNSAAKTFTYTLGTVQGAATANGTLKVYNTVSGGAYSAGSTTVRITANTSAAHGYSTGTGVVLAGVTPSSANGITVYNGAVTVATVPASQTFTYDMSFASATPLFPPADATAFGAVYTGASTTVTATVPSTAGLASPLDITGIDACYNRLGAPATIVNATTLTYQTTTACPPLAAVPAGAQASFIAAYTTTVTATLPNHGFPNFSQVVIADGTAAAHNGPFNITVVDANTFTYLNPLATVGPAGQYTARLSTNPVVYATAPAHGFATGDTLTITGGNPADYNGSFTITAIDADTFSYVPGVGSGTGIGANTGTTVTASKNTTTARATSVNHGFANGSSVQISGATPAAFNGTFTIAYVDDNTFTYTLASPQGDASGTIRAAAGTGSGSERNQLIEWVRGANNAKTTGGENTTAADSSCRATVHGDVLHSRPAVINYNRFGGENDVYVFYGSNDGVFRGIKGGTTTDPTDSTGMTPGAEAWGFVPKESFGDLKRLRNNSPVISSSFKRPYFLDGPIGVYSIDGNGDGKLLSSTTSDHVFLYIGARRGGRYLYSLDVTDPNNPSYRWKIDNSTTGFAELGETWSQPTVVTGIAGYSNPVLIFGGGYDAAAEDPEYCTITGTTAASYAAGVYTPGTVTYNAGKVVFHSLALPAPYNTATGCTVEGAVSTTVPRTRGRAIYIVDAITGEKIWSASYQGSGADIEVPGMDFSIASDVTVVKNLSGGDINRAYVGDTGGNLWRIDFGSTNKANWSVTKIAALADLTTKTGGYITGYRKFLAPPDVVEQPGDSQTAYYDAILLGSGDREHPFDNTVQNRFYMLKDRGSDAGPGTGTTYYLADTNSDGIGDTPAVNARTTNRVITHSNTTDGNLYDATNDCAQSSTNVGCTGTTPAGEAVKIDEADGWFFTLRTGEKTIGRAVVLNNVCFFNTNQPSSTSSAASTCDANLGIARQYQVLVTNAGAARQGETTAEGRSVEHAGGGYLPDPVHVVVQVTNSEGEVVTKEGVISGTAVETPATGAVGQRTRRFWYKEID